MQPNIWQIIFLALLQGVTELFPISSLGHTVIVTGLFGWGNLLHDTACHGESCFVPLNAALHLGTMVALLIFFWRDWLQVARTVVSGLKTRQVRKGTEEWVSLLIIVGCIPAGLIGLLLEKQLKAIFSSPVLGAAFLIVNGSVLFAGEQLRRRAEAQWSLLSPQERESHFRPLKALTIKEALMVGCMQSLALIPGFSRSGSTIVGGLMVRLTHEDAARFAFLLGTPLIGAAGALEVPKLLHLPTGFLLLVLLGSVLAGIAAYLSTRFLMKYFETGRLDPFAYYCWGAGIVALIVLIFVVRVPL